ncbi:hypothetical protein F7725_007167 [Dissostichus mawsoni]|uniref:Uncharacterized protein n=1 Tax=Dissostichus mawsoni TaxID=36200 RepID=A0A7J5XW22_DISMA|nr:hypothetical protein F7725_007167 [Dissostichus mawsoni]
MLLSRCNKCLRAEAWEVFLQIRDAAAVSDYLSAVMELCSLRDTTQRMRSAPFPTPAELDAFAKKVANNPLTIKIFPNSVKVPQRNHVRRTVNGLDTSGQRYSPYPSSQAKAGLLAVIKGPTVKGILKDFDGSRARLHTEVVMNPHTGPYQVASTSTLNHHPALPNLTRLQQSLPIQQDPPQTLQMPIPPQQARAQGVGVTSMCEGQIANPSPINRNLLISACSRVSMHSNPATPEVCVGQPYTLKPPIERPTPSPPVNNNGMPGHMAHYTNGHYFQSHVWNSSILPTPNSDSSGSQDIAMPFHGAGPGGCTTLDCGPPGAPHYMLGTSSSSSSAQCNLMQTADYLGGDFQTPYFRDQNLGLMGKMHRPPLSRAGPEVGDGRTALIQHPGYR